MITNKISSEPSLEAHEMAIANWKNQTIWTADNLYVMRGMNSESVDLIYLDPPFNSKTNYAAPIGSKAAGAAFKDTWSLSDLDKEWINLLDKGKYASLRRILLAAITASDKSYLVYMASRLLEMKRLLKPTGSIYLHCDPTMSHYLKLVMDAIFGKGNFRNEIVWKRKTGRGETNHRAKRYGTVTDQIFYYSKSSSGRFLPQYDSRSSDYVSHIAKTFPFADDFGCRYGTDNLASPSYRENLIYDYRGYPPPPKGWAISKATMAQWDLEGRLAFPKNPLGRIRRKRFLNEYPGRPISNLWDDIPAIPSHSKERTGYPTQKPLKLLGRIIASNSLPGDVVLDPFCGCATTCIAAEMNGRLWTGIDISPKAGDLLIDRMNSEVEALYKGAIRTDIPRRTDLGKLPPYNCLPNRKFLYGEQDGNCAGCLHHFEARHLEVDHIIARANGGTDHRENLQLLCSSCNRVKGSRDMEYLKAKLQIAA